MERIFTTASKIDFNLLSKALDEHNQNNETENIEENTNTTLPEYIEIDHIKDEFQKVKIQIKNKLATLNLKDNKEYKKFSSRMSLLFTSINSHFLYINLDEKKELISNLRKYINLVCNLDKKEDILVNLDTFPPSSKFVACIPGTLERLNNAVISIQCNSSSIHKQVFSKYIESILAQIYNSGSYEIHIFDAIKTIITGSKEGHYFNLASTSLNNLFKNNAVSITMYLNTEVILSYISIIRNYLISYTDPIDKNINLYAFETDLKKIFPFLQNYNTSIFSSFLEDYIDISYNTEEQNLITISVLFFYKIFQFEEFKEIAESINNNQPYTPISLEEFIKILSKRLLFPDLIPTEYKEFTEYITSYEMQGFSFFQKNINKLFGQSLNAINDNTINDNNLIAILLICNASQSHNNIYAIDNFIVNLHKFNKFISIKEIENLKLALQNKTIPSSYYSSLERILYNKETKLEIKQKIIYYFLKNDIVSHISFHKIYGNKDLMLYITHILTDEQNPIHEQNKLCFLKRIPENILKEQEALQYIVPILKSLGNKNLFNYINYL